MKVNCTRVGDFRSSKKRRVQIDTNKNNLTARKLLETSHDDEYRIFA